MEKVDQAMELLKEVFDPELGINIVDLGLVYDVQMRNDDTVYVKMTLTTPGCPLHDTIVGGVKRVLADQMNVESDVEVVWEPAWTPEKMSDDAREILGFF